MLKKVSALLAGVILASGCAAGLSETDVDARIESAISTAVAEIPTPQPTATPQPTIFTEQLAIMRAQSYEIVDPEGGQLRAVLSLQDDGSTSLKLLDAGGIARAVLVLSPADIAALVLADAEGIARAGLTVAPDGEATLLFQDALGNVIASYP